MGVDIHVPHGAPIRAAKAGAVVFSGLRGGYGNAVIIQHDAKSSSLYAHCSRLHVKRGQKVHQGQVIAAVGETGRATGPHLHFEIRTGGGAVNPLEFWRKHAESSAQ
ncbi:MAG TPA: M23 family metallopeptidase [Synergistales bacterium]|nr:M23 family metallopeptidase [Synergistaceae bacterium]HPE65597.1 M23 family metallopeptidase [Synergistales bacterium]